MPRARLPLPPGDPHFALRFRLLLSYHDLGLREVARATGCAVSTAGTWRAGRRPASPEAARRLAAVFGVSVDYLLWGRPTRTPADAAAGRILDDLEVLLRELERPPRPLATANPGPGVRGTEPERGGRWDPPRRPKSICASTRRGSMISGSR